MRGGQRLDYLCDLPKVLDDVGVALYDFLLDVQTQVAPGLGGVLQLTGIEGVQRISDLEVGVGSGEDAGELGRQGIGASRWRGRSGFTDATGTTDAGED